MSNNNNDEIIPCENETAGMKAVIKITNKFNRIGKYMEAQTKLNDMLLNLLHAKCYLTDGETRELAALVRAVKDVL